MAESERGSVTKALDAARAGDVDAKVWLWERYRSLLYAMAQDHSDDDTRSGAADTSDVVAEAQLRIFADDFFDDIESREHFKNLLRRIVAGKAIDLQRRNKVRKADSFNEHAELEPVAKLNLRLDVLNELKEGLPLHLYQTVEAMLEHGTEQAAADALGISRHELRNRLDEIRVIWSKHLGDE